MFNSNDTLMKNIFTVITLLLTLGISAYAIDDISIIQTEQESVSFKIKGKTDSNFLMVIRKAEINNYPPTNGTLYKPVVDIKTADKDIIGIRNFPIFSGKVNNKDLNITGLTAGTKYKLDVYSYADTKNPDYSILTKSFDIMTLPKSPSITPRNLGISELPDGSVQLSYMRGNGDATYVFVSEKKDIELPKNKYESIPNNTYGKSIIKGTKTSCIDKNTGTNHANAIIKGLKPGNTYTIAAIEANGAGETTVYAKPVKKKVSFIRTYTVLPPAPKALEASDVTSNHFLARWEKLDDAKNYVLDVAEDKSFTKTLTKYYNITIMPVQDWDIDDLEAGKTYYYRVRAILKNGMTGFSNVIEVKTEKE